MSDEKVSLFPGVSNVTYFRDTEPLTDKTRLSMIAMLEETVDAIKAGEVVGVGLVMMTHDNCGGWKVCGRIGSYSMLGAADVLRQELLDAARGSD